MTYLCGHGVLGTDWETCEHCFTSTSKSSSRAAEQQRRAAEQHRAELRAVPECCDRHPHASTANEMRRSCSSCGVVGLTHSTAGSAVSEQSASPVLTASCVCVYVHSETSMQASSPATAWRENCSAACPQSAFRRRRTPPGSRMRDLRPSVPVPPCSRCKSLTLPWPSTAAAETRRLSDRCCYTDVALRVDRARRLLGMRVATRRYPDECSRWSRSCSPRYRHSQVAPPEPSTTHFNWDTGNTSKADDVGVDAADVTMFGRQRRNCFFIPSQAFEAPSA